MLSFFPRDVLDEIMNLIESVSEGFLPTLDLWQPVSHFMPEIFNLFDSGQTSQKPWRKNACVFWSQLFEYEVFECDIGMNFQGY